MPARVGGFEELWARRTTIEVAGERVDLPSVEDLVRAKKTNPPLKRLEAMRLSRLKREGRED